MFANLPSIIEKYLVDISTLKSKYLTIALFGYSLNPLFTDTLTMLNYIGAYLCSHQDVLP